MSSKSCVCALLALLWCADVQASGFFVQDVGQVGIARAGAVVASGDDLNALWYNPANLSAGRGLRLQVDLNLNWKQIDWQRASDTTVGTGFARVHNEPVLVPVPTLAVAYDFGVPGLAVAFGVYAPNNSNTIFPDNGGPQRYSVVRSGSFLVFFHFALSYQPWPWLRFGAGVFGTSVFFDQSMAVNVGLGGPENKDFDIYVDVFGTQHFLMNANVGVWVMPGAGFEVGASFLPGRKAQASGTFRVRPSETLQKLLSVDGDRAEFSVNFPWIARAGVAWRYADVFVAEAAFVYEGWSSLRNILISPRGVSLKAPPIIDSYDVGDIVLDRGWVDTYSVRFGAQGLVYRPYDLKVSAGYGYEPGAVPDVLLSVSANDSTKHNVGVGVSMRVDRWKFGLAYGHSIYVEKNVTTSQLRLTNPLNADQATVIGNGRYLSGHQIVSASVGVGFL